jgi:hypothetical protein
MKPQDDFPGNIPQYLRMYEKILPVKKMTSQLEGETSNELSCYSKKAIELLLRKKEEMRSWVVESFRVPDHRCSESTYGRLVLFQTCHGCWII